MVTEGSQTKKVLVADQQEVSRRRLVGWLREEMFVVIEVDKGWDALSRILAADVDAAIMEEHLFESTIMETLKRKLPLPCSLPMVICTDDNTAPARTFASSEENLVYVAEPLSKNNVLTALLQACTQNCPQESGKRQDPNSAAAEKADLFVRLARGVVHDFNNLLTIIMGAGEILGQNLRSQPTNRVLATQIVEAAQQGANLIGQLQAISKHQLPTPCPQDLNQALQKIRPFLGHVLGRRIKLDMDMGENLSKILADSGQLDQVILNLALNARDAMPQGGKLMVTTAMKELDQPLQGHDTVPPGSYVVLTVSDTGTGMDDATLNHLFQPFFTTKEQGKGSGLGLANVLHILHATGAYITVASQPNQDTTFNVFFPKV